MKRNCPSLKFSRKYKNQDRSKYSKSYNRNEEEEVESLLEILKYSSECENEKDEENYEESQVSSNNYTNENKLEIYKNIIDDDSYYKKRMMKYRKREKKKKKMNESEKMLKKHKIYKKFKNKHVQTDEQIFNDIFYDDINTNVKNNFSDIIDQNVKNLKIKFKEYKNDVYYTAIVCEQCKGLYIDTLLMYDIINYKIYNDSIPLFHNDELLSLDNEQNKIAIKKASSYTNINYNDTFIKKNKHRFISNTLNSISHSLPFYKKRVSEEICSNNDGNNNGSKNGSNDGNNDGNDNGSGNISSGMASSCEHEQIDKDCVKNEDIKLDNISTVIHKFVEENIPNGFILCTCRSDVLRYKSIRLKKENINGIKKYNVNSEKKKKIFFSKIKNVILKLKNELSQIRGTIDNLFFSNKNNLLLNDILNSSYFKDIPSIVYNHVYNTERKNENSMDKLLTNNINDNSFEIFQINKKENISNNYLLDNINNFKGISEIDRYSNSFMPIRCDNNIIEKKEINICENIKPSKYLCTNKNDKFETNANEIISKKYNQNDLKEQTFSFKYLIENYDIKNITTFFICCVLSINEIHTNLCIPFMKNNSYHDISSSNFGMEKNEIKIIDIINNDSENIKYNKIKETESFLEEYNIVLNQNTQSIYTKQMAEIENTLCNLSTNIINKIKERYIEITSVYLFIDEHIDDKNIKIADLMRLIDNYGKIYLYLTSLNKISDNQIRSNKKNKLHTEN
ncbi:hypothetical protein [Plasmodium yoelii yoelii]|nr:hypothetical protein [Plasmodium yoelii yoelii]